MPTPPSPPGRTDLRLALEAGPNTLAVAERLRVSGVPIDGTVLLEAGVPTALAPLKSRGLAPCQVNAFFFNPLHPDPAQRAAGAERLSRLLPLAAAAGAPAVAFGAGSFHADIFGGADSRNREDVAVRLAAGVLAPLAAQAERCGIILSLEPHLRSVLFAPELSAALCAHVGSAALRVTFDVSNYYDFADLLNPGPMLGRCATALASCTGLTHLKEVAVQPGFHLHAGLVALGAGATDWTAVLAVTRAIAPRNGWVLVEHCSSEAEAERSIALVRDAARTAGIAFPAP